MEESRMHFLIGLLAALYVLAFVTPSLAQTSERIFTTIKDEVDQTNGRVLRGPYHDEHWGKSELTVFLNDSKILWVMLDTKASLRFLLVPVNGGSIKVVATQRLSFAVFEGRKSRVTVTTDEFETSDHSESARMSQEYGIPDWGAFYKKLTNYFESHRDSFPEVVNTSLSTPKRRQTTLDDPLFMKL